MTDWTSGYVADIGYTFGYYGELNPLRAKFALTLQGVACGEFENACELGFGQGISINVHAAASSAEWMGTDFNPAQASMAAELASASGAKLRVFDEAFEEFAARDDLPSFDFIGLHGIWSWISDSNRDVIAQFVRRRLKIGGVLYVSYNTLPGWATFAPMRHLMTQHVELASAEGLGTVGRVDAALAFADRLLGTEPAFLKVNPVVAERMSAVRQQNRQYLAHEYFNRDWHPMYFAQMAQWLEPAKVQYAGSAHMLDQIDVLNLTPAQQAMLAEVTSPELKEGVRDFMVNQQFRRDYWVKGMRRLSALEQVETLRGMRVMLTVPRDAVVLKATGAVGSADLHAGVYGPILDALADPKPRTVAQLEKSIDGRGITPAQFTQALMILAGTGQLVPVQDDAVATKAKRATDKLNAKLLLRARSSGDIQYLASPMSGGAVLVPRFQQIFLLARSQGLRTPEEWARFTWQQLDMQGQRLVKDGQTLNTAEENLASLETQAREFAEKSLPILKTLQIA